MLVVAIVTVVVLLLLWPIFIYNRFVAFRNEVKKDELEMLQCLIENRITA